MLKKLHWLHVGYTEILRGVTAESLDFTVIVGYGYTGYTALSYTWMFRDINNYINLYINNIII